MKAVFRNFISFLSFLVKVFGEKHYQGYFDFVGFITSPQLSSVINEFHQKSLFECSSECLLNENCYIFDFCENGSSISCYFYHYDIASTSDVESGACRRYELKQACTSGYTSPCRCPKNEGFERCNYNTDCSRNMSGKNKTSHNFYRKFPNKEVKEMWCEMEIDNGGWIVFQRRVDGTTDFYRGWEEYENGFGVLANNFYMGNYYLHELVKSGDYELRIDLEDQAGERAYAGYTNFTIGGPSISYMLNVSGFHGNASDSLDYHSEMMFTTYDKDNDGQSFNCAVANKGAWWHKTCHFSNLNGQYGIDNATGIIWNHWRGYYHSLNGTRMMVRRKIE